MNKLEKDREDSLRNAIESLDVKFQTLRMTGQIKMTDQGEIRDSWNLTTLSKVKEGDFFRLSENGAVYIREDYERSLGRYRVTKAENMNAETFKKGSVIVQTGFDY